MLTFAIIFFSSMGLLGFGRFAALVIADVRRAHAAAQRGVLPDPALDSLTPAQRARLAAFMDEAHRRLCYQLTARLELALYGTRMQRLGSQFPGRYNCCPAASWGGYHQHWAGIPQGRDKEWMDVFRVELPDSDWVRTFSGRSPPEEVGEWAEDVS